MLEVHLAMLKRRGAIEAWHDRRILAGHNIDDAISDKLESADVILLLVSPDFLASDYCYDREMMRAMERHNAGAATVIPIILRPCDWKEAPFGKLLACPRDGKPITRWPDLDEAFLDVVRAIKGALEESKNRTHPEAPAVGIRPTVLPARERPRAAPNPEPSKFATWIEESTKRWNELVATVPPPDNGKLLGNYRVAYLVDGAFSSPTLPELRRKLDDATIRHTGWPAWWVPTREGIKPYIHLDAVECFLGGADHRIFSDPAHSDFWRVRPDGCAFLVRGFDEDSHPDQVQPGKKFDITLPIWRVGECLLHAASLAQQLGAPEAKIHFAVRYSGLSDRDMFVFQNRIMVDARGRARQDQIDCTTEVVASQINASLPELVHKMLSPLYALFDFFELPKRLVDEQLRELRSGRF